MTIWKFTSKSINLLPLFKNLLKFRASHGRTFSVRADFAELARVCLQHSGDNRFIVYANPLGISLLSMTNCRPGFSGTPNMDRGREKSFWISDVWMKWKFSLVLKVQLSSGMESHNLSGKYWIWKSASPCRISCNNDDDDMECDRVTRRHCRTFRSTRLFDVTFPVNCARS